MDLNKFFDQDVNPFPSYQASGNLDREHKGSDKTSPYGTAHDTVAKCYMSHADYDFDPEAKLVKDIWEGDTLEAGEYDIFVSVLQPNTEFSFGYGNLITMPGDFTINKMYYIVEYINDLGEKVQEEVPLAINKVGGNDFIFSEIEATFKRYERKNWNYISPILANVTVGTPPAAGNTMHFRFLYSGV